MLTNSRNSAFTTPELLMTLMIFSFGLLPLIVLFRASHKTTAQAKHLMIAQSLGRTIIDEVRALGYDSLKYEMENPSGVFGSWRQITGPLVPTDPDSIVYPDSYGRFQVHMRGTLLEESGKCLVELEIKWEEPGREFNLGFGTVVVKRGG